MLGNHGLKKHPTPSRDEEKPVVRTNSEDDAGDSKDDDIKDASEISK